MPISLPDPRNDDILIHVGGELVPREDAKVSVFDSVVQGGDAVWEGLRVYDGRIFELDAHLDRLFDSAHAMAFAEVPSREEVKKALFETLEANGMRDEVHIRLTLTRGKKTTSGMDPRLNIYGPTLIVLAEWKKPVYAETGDQSDARLRRDGHPTDHRVGAPQHAAVYRFENPPQQPDQQHPGEDPGQPRGR